MVEEKPLPLIYFDLYKFIILIKEVYKMENSKISHLLDDVREKFKEAYT